MVYSETIVCSSKGSTVQHILMVRKPSSFKSYIGSDVEAIL